MSFYSRGASRGEGSKQPLLPPFNSEFRNYLPNRSATHSTFLSSPSSAPVLNTNTRNRIISGEVTQQPRVTMLRPIRLSLEGMKRKGLVPESTRAADIQFHIIDDSPSDSTTTTPAHRYNERPPLIIPAMMTIENCNVNQIPMSNRASTPSLPRVLPPLPAPRRVNNLLSECDERIPRIPSSASHYTAARAAVAPTAQLLSEYREAIQAAGIIPPILTNQRVEEGQQPKKKRKLYCNYPDCDNWMRCGGRCFRHGGGKRCSVPKCLKAVQKNGKCYLHGEEMSGASKKKK